MSTSQIDGIDLNDFSEADQHSGSSCDLLRHRSS